MAETIFYQDDYALVSNARVVMGEKTYALRNITSVNTRKIPPNQTLAVALIVIGVFFLIGLLSFGPYGGKPEPSYIIVTLLMIGAGFYQFFKAKPSYVILFNSSGGEIQAILSFDKERIDNITKAINDAIIHQA